MEKKLETTIRDALRGLCDERGKQRPVAEKLGISQQYLNRLLNGTRPVSGLTIETVQRMFPHATFNLNGDAVSIHADQNSGSVVGVNRGHVSTVASESFRLRILEAVIGLDIPADALQIVLKTIKEIKP
jgi:transcriptional regulator with XRE-family HTH domain